MSATSPAGGTWLRALVVATGLFAVLLAVVVGHQRGAGPMPAAPRVDLAPALVGTTLSGDRFDLREARGRFVLVNLWASWCAPCREEMPLLVDAAGAPPLRRVELVGIDVRDPAVAARQFLADIGASGTTHVMDPEGRAAVQWGARGLPQTFLVDPHGRVVASRSGPLDQRWLDDVVAPLVVAS